MSTLLYAAAKSAEKGVAAFAAHIVAAVDSFGQAAGLAGDMLAMELAGRRRTAVVGGWDRRTSFVRRAEYGSGTAVDIVAVPWMIQASLRSHDEL